MKQKIATILLALAWMTTGWIAHAQAEGLPVVKNLKVEAKESAGKQAPILLLVMSKTCMYCERVLREFLLPMQRNAEYNDKVILRQIEISSNSKLIDFDGKTTSQSAFAKAHQVMAVPTVLLLNENGIELTRITGLASVEFYQSYLDAAINESLASIKSRAR